MTSWAGNYQTGRPYAQCDRCDRKMRLDELKREWSGIMACARCRDPRPEHLSPPKINPREGAAIPNARPGVIIEATDEQLAFEYRNGDTYDPDNPTDLGG